MEWASYVVIRKTGGLTALLVGPPGGYRSGTHVVSCSALIGLIFEDLIAYAVDSNDLPFWLPVLLTRRGTGNSVFVFNLPPQMLLLILSTIRGQGSAMDYCNLKSRIVMAQMNFTYFCSALSVLVVSNSCLFADGITLSTTNNRHIAG